MKEEDKILISFILGIFVGAIVLFFSSPFTNTNQSEITEKENEYLELFMKGINTYIVAENNFNYAKADLDNALNNYEANFYNACKGYAESCNVYFDYAYSNYRDAEKLFKRSKETNSTIGKLAYYMEKISHYNKLIAIENYQACEYLESACNSYSLEEWEIGNEYIEEYIKHIKKHDEFVGILNDWVSEYKAYIKSLA